MGTDEQDASPRVPFAEVGERAGRRPFPEASSGSWREVFFRVVPAFDSLRTYSWPSFRLDLMAGLTVATVALPQAMAYATIAGLPPQYGLYTAIVMTAVGALFDSSKQLINGPTNAISIALLSALAAFADPADPAKIIPLAILMAMLVGLIQTGITLLRLGDLSRYVSQAVIVGFTLGAAGLLVLDQFKNLLGLTARPAGRPLPEAFLADPDGSGWNPWLDVRGWCRHGAGGAAGAPAQPEDRPATARVPARDHRHGWGGRCVWPQGPGRPGGRPAAGSFALVQCS